MRTEVEFSPKEIEKILIKAAKYRMVDAGTSLQCQFMISGGGRVEGAKIWYEIPEEELTFPEGYFDPGVVTNDKGE